MNLEAEQLTEIDRAKARPINTGAGKLAPLLALLCSCWNPFYDEGARFANQVADFASKFRRSPETTATFEYVPRYGNGQHIRVGIGRIRFCPKPPCYGQGAATVWVEHGENGTGYRIGSAASVPEPLELDKNSGPIRVHMRKVAGIVEVVGLD